LNAVQQSLPFIFADAGMAGGGDNKAKKVPLEAKLDFIVGQAAVYRPVLGTPKPGANPTSFEFAVTTPAL
jgi:hypothetical protein